MLGDSSYDHILYFEDNAHQHVAGSEVVVRDLTKWQSGGDVAAAALPCAAAPGRAARRTRLVPVKCRASEAEPVVREDRGR
jgi:hypothetical protein